MSFILEALRRAERERRAAGGAGPGPMGKAARAPFGRRGPRVLAWALAGAASLAALFGLFLRIPARGPEAPVVSSAPPSDVRSGPIPAVPVPVAPRPAPSLPALPVSSVPAARARVALPAASPGPAFSPAPAPAAKPAPFVAPAATPATTQPAAEPAPALTPAPVPPKPAAAAPAPPSEPPLVRELPEEVRARIGPLEVSAHVYAENPAERFLFVNGKICRVGERIGTGGAVIERITPEGAVIDYGGGRARLEAGR